MSQEVHYLETGSQNPFYNLAFEETVLRNRREGEYLLLCSDGLVNTVTDQEMLFEVIHGDGPDTCLDRLLAIAKRQGAPDNVTAVLMQMQ